MPLLLLIILLEIHISLAKFSNLGSREDSTGLLRRELNVPLLAPQRTRFLPSARSQPAPVVLTALVIRSE